MQTLESGLENPGAVLRDSDERNGLLCGMARIQGRVAQFKEQARHYYYCVILTGYDCPWCGARLKMVGASRCRCSGGHVLDPTLTFQRSACCGARLARRTHHYACASCDCVVPSRFLFDECLFNARYFREKMRQSRRDREERLERLKQLLFNARSGSLPIGKLPRLDDVPGLTTDLDQFLGTWTPASWMGMSEEEVFRLEDYRHLILARVDGCVVLFSAFPPLIRNERLDRARRFLTLTFLWQDREVMLTQRGNDIAVEAYEADSEGR